MYTLDAHERSGLGTQLWSPVIEDEGIRIELTSVALACLILADHFSRLTSD